MTRTTPDAWPQAIVKPDLREISQKVLWLATSIVNAANNERPNTSGIKVGGHQASSASMVDIMVSLWFAGLTRHDRVSVKPHASPVLHAINYLIGDLDEKYLTTLRAKGGLQSYPSRHKDPDTVDFSTGSVGIGATAPLWAAMSHRYLSSQFSTTPEAGRFISLLGDAELDEGAVWEAVIDPAVAKMGELMWIVDLNRQSLDRVVPDVQINRLQSMFEAAGWQVMTLKWGRAIMQLFQRPGGEDLRVRLEQMPNEEYQRMLRAEPADVAERLLGAHASPALRTLVNSLDTTELTRAIRDLGGHDIDLLLDTYDKVDSTRPTVIFAYTIKGRGLPTEGHPNNHSALLTEDQVRALADSVGADASDPWQRFEPGSAAALLCADRQEALRRTPIESPAPDALPTTLARAHRAPISTQAALGRFLTDLTRDAPATAARVVTCSPDVASSTNLGGWINKTGVWSVTDRLDWFADDSQRVLRWQEVSSGQHIELGIAEVNLVGLLSELGATWSRWGERLIPIATIYDPFISRALEPWSFGIYAGGQSIIVGTPSGVTLSPKAVLISRSPHLPSGWSNPVARRGSRPSRRTWSGACSRRWARSAFPAVRRRTSGSRHVRSTRPRPRSPRIRYCSSAVVATPWPGATASPTTPLPPRRSRSSEWEPSCPRCWPRPRTSRSSESPPAWSASPAPTSSSVPPRAAAPTSPTSSSRRPVQHRWSPSWTATRTRCRSWAGFAATAPATSASPTSASPPTSRMPTRCTASTPRPSWTPHWGSSVADSQVRPRTTPAPHRSVRRQPTPRRTPRSWGG